MAQDAIDTKASNKALIISGLVIMLLLAGLFTNGFGLFSRSPTGNVVTADQTEFIPLAVGKSPVLGHANAPVTVYEFSDFSCPYCGAAAGQNRLYMDTLKSQDKNWIAPIPAIERDYIESGKVKLVFKYSPGHGSGQSAHRVGWCLNDQNLFWEFHDKAFANQDDTGNLEKMKTLASELGADMTQLQSCLDSHVYDTLFREDEAMGASNGVQGTPAFFINGKLISGAQSYTQLKALIDKELG